MHKSRALIVLLLVLGVAALTSIAYATPPDPIYIPGLWDDDDYDNVVTLATSSSGTTDSHAPLDLTHLLIFIAPVAGRDDGQLPTALSAPYPPRAPPAA